MTNEINNLKTLINEGQNDYTFVDCKAKRSDVWQKFQVVSDSEGKPVYSSEKPDHQFVRCKTCYEIFLHNSIKGTTVIKRHSCGEASDSIEQTNKNKASAEQKRETLEAILKFVVKDLRPFHLVDCDGFIEFVQAILKIQYKCTKLLDAKDLLPHSTTIGRHVHEFAEKSKVKVKDFLGKVDATDVGIAFGTDIWTDPNSKVNSKL